MSFSTSEKKAIGKRLAQLRLNEGWTQRVASERMDIDEKFLSNLENGHKPLSMAMLKMSSQVYGTTTDYIMFGRGKMYVNHSLNKFLLQKKYCHQNGIPLYISMDGKCPNCGDQVVNNLNEFECSNTHVKKCGTCGGVL